MPKILPEWIRICFRELLYTTVPVATATKNSSDLFEGDFVIVTGFSPEKWEKSSAKQEHRRANQSRTGGKPKP